MIVKFIHLLCPKKESGLLIWKLSKRKGGHLTWDGPEYHLEIAAPLSHDLSKLMYANKFLLHSAPTFCTNFSLQNYNQLSIFLSNKLVNIYNIPSGFNPVLTELYTFTTSWWPTQGSYCNTTFCCHQ